MVVEVLFPCTCTIRSCQLLGQGSFGQVWRAVDREKSQQLAVKIYKATKLKNLDVKKLVETEVRCVSNPSLHSCVVACAPLTPIVTASQHHENTEAC